MVVGRGRQRKTVLQSKNLLRFIKIWHERKASKLNTKKKYENKIAGQGKKRIKFAKILRNEFQNT